MVGTTVDASKAQIGEQKAIPPIKFHDLLTKGPFEDDLRQELATHGYYVVREAIPRERALEYRQRAFDWLEGFKLGFDRNDESTWTNAHLPPHIKGGMFASKIYHEQYLWDIRTEPGVVGAFAQLWGTDKLTTSFDGGSIMLHHRKDLPPSEKWEHMDQSPNRQGFFCAQGLVNLNENGPDDGGLMVLKGSSLILEEYFKLFPEEKANHHSWGPADWYGFTQKQQEWFFERGCEWIKVCAGPGDLILWDSRTMHYNRPPTGDRDRVCTYVCMAPDELLNDTDRATKAELFRTHGATTHNPFENIFVRAQEEGELQTPPKATDQVLKLAGIMPY
ncbi:hypothetical protein MNV49_005115 [Pseudohyphozyma bogoriensis]|nr:hypothetical protein MNV49_005115 [Pseudohyphozyma bogoriensis]